MITVPAEFAQLLVDREGESGRTWLDSLPGLVDSLLVRWECAPTGPITHGQVGIVVPVQREVPSVVKVSFPHPGNVYEPHAFAAWAGNGAVRLYERDDAHFAMLLERVESETVGCLDDHAAIAVAGRLSRQLAIEAPPELPLLRDIVVEWPEQMSKAQTRQGNPLPHRVIDAALATILELGTKQPATLVHGDLHYGNILRGRRSPWLAIDPKGYVGDPAYDAITVLTGGAERMLAAGDLRTEVLRRLAIFADNAELDRERVRRWTQLRAVRSAQESRDCGDPTWVVQVKESLAAILS
jgi:streptomycin 6-kinase